MSRVLGRQKGETDLGVGRSPSLLVGNLCGFVHCYVQPFASEAVVERDMNASAFGDFLQVTDIKKLLLSIVNNKFALYYAALT